MDDSREGTIRLAERPSPKVDAAGDESGRQWQPWIPVVAAWLLPGLGHFLVGKRARAAAFAAVIWISYGLGLAHDGSLALRDGKQPFLTTLQIVANLGVGPVDLAARLAVYGAPTYSMGRVRPTAAVPIYRDRIRSDISIYGTAYLWTAGLMNLLLLFDVWDIARRRKD